MQQFIVNPFKIPVLIWVARQEPTLSPSLPQLQVEL